MPLYEYKCSACDDVFEVIQKFADEPLHVHPGCGGAVERLVSAPSLQFKGSGWYVTDYGRNGSFARDKSKAEGTEGKKTESSDKKSSDSKSSDSKKGESSKPAAAPAKESSSSTTKSD